MINVLNRFSIIVYYKNINNTKNKKLGELAIVNTPSFSSLMIFKSFIVYFM